MRSSSHSSATPRRYLTSPFTPPCGVSGQVLAVGIRTMYVFFTTYAIALYADPKDVRSALSSFKVGHAAPLPSFGPFHF